VKVAKPLPECALCEMPTSREAYLANGGLCTPCTSGIDATVRMVRLPPAPDQFVSDATAYVEQYRPPVPGQLAIDEEQQ
jgi:hypothetical protein